MKKVGFFFAAMLLTTAFIATQCTWAPRLAADAPKVDGAVERAKRELSMLDDLYKTSIVLITTHYVDNKDSLPAGLAFKKLFEAMKEKKWHEVRLIDGTGDPYNPDNVAETPFEKKAINKILAGEAKVEEVSQIDGKRFLLGATAIPVVMDKCVICHQVYADAPKGKAIGAVSYKIPIIDNL